MIIQEVNVLALAQAAELVAGPQVAQAIAQMYRVLDGAMFAGYELGRQDGEARTDEATAAAFDNAHGMGQEEGFSDGYDQGYLDGVDHARRRPDLADDFVGEILAAQAFYDDDGGIFDDEDFDTIGCGDPHCFICGDPGDDFYEGDSGDETDR